MPKYSFLFFVLILSSLFLVDLCRGDENKTPHNPTRVLPPGSERLLYRKLFYDAKDITNARRKELEGSLSSTEDADKRRQQLKRAYAELLGPLPAKSPLKPRVTGRIEKDGYRIEKILFQSQPGHHVTANLYIPTLGKPPYPGVLLACGHSDNGKAYAAYQAAAALMAQNGLVVLCYDPISQGERIQLPDAPRYGTTTHTLLDLGALLVGRSTVWYELVDGMRSLDYLRTRPEVDPKKPIGLTGTSGGGTQTTFFMAADPRIGPAAPSCYLMTRLRKFETVGPSDGCQWLPGEGAARIDHFDYCVMRADKPTLVLAARDDFFDILSSRAAADETRRVYRALGKEKNFDFFEAPSPHGFQRPHRQEATRFMRQCLLGDATAIRETDFEPLPDEAVRVTQSGQVLEDFPEETTVAAMNLQAARKLGSARRAFWESTSEEDQHHAIAELTGLTAMLLQEGPLSIENQGTIERTQGRIEKIVLTREGDVPLPALFYMPRAKTGGKNEPLQAVLYIDGRGKQSAAGDDGEIERLVASGKAVLTVDLRGYGETRDTGSYHKDLNDEERTSMLAMYLGKPLLGQRVADVKTCLDFLERQGNIDATAVELVAVGRAGPVGLHAAYFDPRIRKLVLKDSIRSWIDDVVAKPLAPHLLAQVVPGALKFYDLTDLEAALGDRIERQ
ncbi:MAG: hypothetical protein VX431_03255 [Planctomycetota bacterium]|nr:hypothetical protein [Planctomycetota bacterium]